MFGEINSVFSLLNKRLLSLDSSLANEVEVLRENTNQVLLEAPKFDFKDIEANGFRSFSRLVLLFGRLAVTHQHLNQIRDVTRVLSVGVSLCLQMIKMDNLFSSSPKQFIHLLEVFETLSPHLDVIYSDFCSFWLCKSMRRTMNGFTALMAIYSASKDNNWFESSRSLFSRECRAHTVAHIAQNANVQFVKSFWGLTEIPILRRTLPSLAHKRPTIMKELLIPRQTKYAISRSEAKVLREDFGQRRQSSVRCRLLSASIKSDTVVLHAHGGGFVSQSPESHEVYLREWCFRLEGTSIISVDYSLSPQNQYPEALQELLDVYLWLIWEQKEIAVREIVLCGDSAGGNLCVALSLALHQIAEAKQPKAVLSFYAPLMLQTRASPSRLMTAVDTLLPLGVLLSCLGAYAIPLEEECSLPWYRNQQIQESLKTLNHVTQNAFISPVLAKDFPKSVVLYLVGLHFDACLDDSIQMASKWKGPVVLDVLDELPHGFLNFVMLSSESKRGSDLCADRIKQSLI